MIPAAVLWYLGLKFFAEQFLVDLVLSGFRIDRSMAMERYIAIVIDLDPHCDGDGDQLGPCIAIGAIDIDTIANPLFAPLIAKSGKHDAFRKLYVFQLGSILSCYHYQGCSLLYPRPAVVRPETYLREQ